MLKFILFSLFFISGVYAQNLRHHDTAGLGVSNCNSSDFCGINGQCVENICKCDKGFVTEIQPCEYEQKKQLTAFILQVFVGAIGVSHFYIGQVLIGVIKILLIFLPCCMCSAVWNSATSDTDPKACVVGGGGCLTVLCSLAVSIWWIVDIVLFALNNYKDKNGIELESW